MKYLVLQENVAHAAAANILQIGVLNQRLKYSQPLFVPYQPVSQRSVLSLGNRHFGVRFFRGLHSCLPQVLGLDQRAGLFENLIENLLPIITIRVIVIEQINLVHQVIFQLQHQVHAIFDHARLDGDVMISGVIGIRKDMNVQATPDGVDQVGVFDVSHIPGQLGVKLRNAELLHWKHMDVVQKKTVGLSFPLQRFGQ